MPRQHSPPPPCLFYRRMELFIISAGLARQGEMSSPSTRPRRLKLHLLTGNNKRRPKQNENMQTQPAIQKRLHPYPLPREQCSCRTSKAYRLFVQKTPEAPILHSQEKSGIPERLLKYSGVFMYDKQIPTHHKETQPLVKSFVLVGALLCTVRNTKITKTAATNDRERLDSVHVMRSTKDPLPSLLPRMASYIPKHYPKNKK